MLPQGVQRCARAGAGNSGNSGRVKGEIGVDDMMKQVDDPGINQGRLTVN